MAQYQRLHSMDNMHTNMLPACMWEQPLNITGVVNLLRWTKTGCCIVATLSAHHAVSAFIICRLLSPHRLQVRSRLRTETCSIRTVTKLLVRAHTWQFRCLANGRLCGSCTLTGSLAKCSGQTCSASADATLDSTHLLHRIIHSGAPPAMQNLRLTAPKSKQSPQACEQRQTMVCISRKQVSAASACLDVTLGCFHECCDKCSVLQQILPLQLMLGMLQCPG